MPNSSVNKPSTDARHICMMRIAKLGAEGQHDCHASGRACGGAGLAKGAAVFESVPCELSLPSPLDSVYQCERG